MIDEKFYAEKIAYILMEKTSEIEDCAIGFSGGLDSGILAYLIENSTLYTLGIKNSKDVIRAKDAAKILGRELEIIEIGEEDVLYAAKFLLQEFGEMSIVELSFEIPLTVLSKHCKENIIVTGQGADELFGGYKKYIGNPSLMGEDFKKLVELTNPREIKIAEKFGKKLVCPYLSEELVSLALEIPVELKIKNGVRKYILREAAKLLGVPEKIYLADKMAVQYGSGVMKILRKMAKRFGVKLADLPRIIIKWHKNQFFPRSKFL